MVANEKLPSEKPVAQWETLAISYPHLDGMLNTVGIYLIASNFEALAWLQAFVEKILVDYSIEQAELKDENNNEERLHRLSVNNRWLASIILQALMNEGWEPYSILLETRLTRKYERHSLKRAK